MVLRLIGVVALGMAGYTVVCAFFPRLNPRLRHISRLALVLVAVFFLLCGLSAFGVGRSIAWPVSIAIWVILFVCSRLGYLQRT